VRENDFYARMQEHTEQPLFPRIRGVRGLYLKEIVFV